MSTRKAFEKWARWKGYETARSSAGELLYVSLAVQALWEAWHDATVTALEDCATACDKAAHKIVVDSKWGDGYVTALNDVANGIRAGGDQE